MNKTIWAQFVHPIAMLTHSFSQLLAHSRRALIPALAAITFSAGAEVITNPVPYAATPLPLSAVRLTGGPLKHAQELDADYLLKLEPDRMLYYLRVHAGLKPKAKEAYGGWDNGSRSLTGHIAGHYLSAVSDMWAATGDERFKARADYIVQELKEVQAAQGDGYIGALMATAPRNYTRAKPNAEGLVDGKLRFEDLGAGIIESGGFDLNGMWSPWYVQHKLFAGLRDAYRLTGNRTALDVEIKFAGWVDGILSRLNEAQIQKMLNCEFGGMNEVMADLYADTGDPRWLHACDYFEHHAVIDPLTRHVDDLGGKHGNTTVPKVLGELKRYLYTGNVTNEAAADFFWDQVVDHHSFATGGHGHDEYFSPADKLNDITDGRDDESCNVYNMLKMTRLLFALTPDPKYAEYQERALFNHVLGSIDPQDGRTCYMVPVGRGVTHEYQDMFNGFTCCVGTGMENHGLLGDGIYFSAAKKLWVNLYTPSTADCSTLGAKLAVQTDFPEGTNVTLTVGLAASKKFTLALRHPAWAGAGFAIRLNGKIVKDRSLPGTYAELNRKWKNGDTVQLVLPKQLHAEPLPDNPGRVALMWGPLVLSGDLGPEENRDAAMLTVPVFVVTNKTVVNWLQPVADHPGEFTSAGAGRGTDVNFVPFYRLHRRTYAAYWDLYTPAEWVQKSAEVAAEKERQHRLEQATVAYAQPGEMQTERDFNEQGEGSNPDRVMGRAARRGYKWFSFDLPVDAAHPMSMLITYYSDERHKRTFDIFVNDRRLAGEVVEKSGAPHFFDREYAIPAELVNGRQKVTVKFVATGWNEIAAVFGIRMIRADAAR